MLIAVTFGLITKFYLCHIYQILYRYSINAFFLEDIVTVKVYQMGLYDEMVNFLLERYDAAED